MAKSDYFTRDSSSHLSKESLLCCICLEVFSDPVTTPCGHNFCKSCLAQCWDRSQLCCCPLCKEKFTNRPAVKINTDLREIVEHFKEKCSLDEPEILCDLCPGKTQKALKSCLDCGMTFCKSHLEPHSQAEKLQQHKLINPVKNLPDYICRRHQRPLQMFCSDDQMGVCEFCTEGDHRNHTIIHIEEETGKRKTQLGKTKTQVQQMIRDRLMKVQEVKRTVELSRNNTAMDNADSAEVFNSLLQSIESCDGELKEVLKRNQTSVEMQAEGLIKQLEQEIAELKIRDTELGKLLDTDNNIQLLQIYSSVYRLPFTNNWTDIWLDNGLSVRTLWTVLTRFRVTLNKTIGEIDLKRVQLDAVDVTLDPDTSSTYIVLSKNLKQVKYVKTPRNVPDTPKRFQNYFMVLGKQGFSSGRFYFEVQVSGKTLWTLGVVQESVNRKDYSIKMTPQNGFWAIILKNGNECFACYDPEILICKGKTTQKVGVYVDYDEHLVYFYDVEAQCRLYSFTRQSFTGMLYPFINPCSDEEGKNLAPLIITPVTQRNSGFMK